MAPVRFVRLEVPTLSAIRRASLPSGDGLLRHNASRPRLGGADLGAKSNERPGWSRDRPMKSPVDAAPADRTVRRVVAFAATEPEGSTALATCRGQDRRRLDHPA